MEGSTKTEKKSHEVRQYRILQTLRQLEEYYGNTHGENCFGALEAF